MTKTFPVILICADAEWRAVLELLPEAAPTPTPYGQSFLVVLGGTQPVVFLHTGWGKIAAAGGTQYAIDRWHPSLLVNLGTCGGFEGDIQRGEIVLAERTLVYDILEQMGDQDVHIEHMATDLDLSWLGSPLPQPVRRTILVSGDRDLLAEDIPWLRQKYAAAAGDWESGAIAFVAHRNAKRLLILRGVTDLVGAGGGEAYGNLHLFEQATRSIMANLLEHLPAWVRLGLEVSPDPG